MQSTMLNIWRQAADQLTPKASQHQGTSHEKNPFEAPSHAQHSRKSSFASFVGGLALGNGSKTPMPRSPTATASASTNPSFFGNLSAGQTQSASNISVPSPTPGADGFATPSAGPGTGTGSLKASQTTSLSKPMPEFTFTANPLSKAKNALRDSVSGGTVSVGAKTPLPAPVGWPGGKAKDATATASTAKSGGTTSRRPSTGAHKIPTSPLATSHPITSQSPTSIVPIPPTPSTASLAPPRGLLAVKIVSARNLTVSQAARPYVVAQYDNNEFVSREAVDEEEAEARGVAAAKKEKVEAESGTKAGEAKGSKGEQSGLSRSAEAKQPRESNGNGIYCLSGQNPLWKQEVDFSSPSMMPSSPSSHMDTTERLWISVYDRSLGDDEEEGGIEGLENFLGEVEIPLNFAALKGNEGWLDQWYPLAARTEEAPITGDVRIQLKYKEVKTRRGLNVNDFEFLKMIGKGTFGRVFQVRKKDTKRIYAMKVLSKKEVIAKKEVQHTIGERNILQRSNECPFLLGLKFSFQSPGELFLVMDYKSGGELFHHLQKEGRFTEERTRFYTAEIVLAFEHLHKYDIVYRDLKPENILLDATGHIVLCDFGLSKPDLPSDALTTTFCGTTEYLAPEVLLDDHGYSKLVDFWSLGVLLFEMCCGWSPFYAEDTQQMYKNICFGKIKFPRGVIGDDGKQFVKGLLNRNPRHRLGSQRDAQDLKEHAFFKSIDFFALEQRQLTPPFKPFVDSDESVANFDAEFTEADIVKEMPMPVFDEDDPSAAWLEQASYANGNAFGSDRSKELMIQPGGRRKSQDSMSEHFRGFSYAGDSEIHLASSKFGMTTLNDG